MTSDESGAVKAALARNDRYLFEFVEALSLCPWARRCREMGRLARRVLLESGKADDERATLKTLTAAAMVQIRGLAAQPPSEVEVGLLIFPSLLSSMREGLEGARAFELLCTAVREAMQREFANAEVPFFCVAFHPELGIDLADENRAVRFIRRSPDPTLQLVRVSVLREARGADQPSTRYVDASRMTAQELLALRSPETISEKIAKANYDSLKREGPEKLRSLLEGMIAR